MSFTSLKNDDIKKIIITEKKIGIKHENFNIMIETEKGESNRLTFTGPKIKLIERKATQFYCFQLVKDGNNECDKFIKFTNKIAKIISWRIHLISETILDELIPSQNILDIITPIIDENLIMILKLYQIHEPKVKLFTHIYNANGEKIKEKHTLDNILKKYKDVIFKPELMLDCIRMGSTIKIFITPLKLTICEKNIPKPQNKKVTEEKKEKNNNIEEEPSLQSEDENDSDYDDYE
jgi:hypothetical protein